MTRNHTNQRAVDNLPKLRTESAVATVARLPSHMNRMVNWGANKRATKAASRTAMKVVNRMVMIGVERSNGRFHSPNRTDGCRLHHRFRDSHRHRRHDSHRLHPLGLHHRRHAHHRGQQRWCQRERRGPGRQ